MSYLLYLLLHCILHNLSTTEFLHATSGLLQKAKYHNIWNTVGLKRGQNAFFFLYIFDLSISQYIKVDILLFTRIIVTTFQSPLAYLAVSSM